jgi:trehalose-6-phosphatase
MEVALFLGDDMTDEDVFRIGAPVVVGVRVGPGQSAARWRIRSQEGVDEVLERLRVLRAPWALRPLKRALLGRALVGRAP